MADKLFSRAWPRCSGQTTLWKDKLCPPFQIHPLHQSEPRIKYHKVSANCFIARRDRVLHPIASPQWQGEGGLVAVAVVGTRNGKLPKP